MILHCSFRTRNKYRQEGSIMYASMACHREDSGVRIFLRYSSQEDGTNEQRNDRPLAWNDFHSGSTAAYWRWEWWYDRGMWDGACKWHHCDWGTWGRIRLGKSHHCGRRDRPGHRIIRDRGKISGRKCVIWSSEIIFEERSSWITNEVRWRTVRSNWLECIIARCCCFRFLDLSLYTIH